ncbi:helix-turn-helix transcriptional regulator [Microbacterium algeriense]|uniref:helix-turn-helix transcriptional regulator n=1 Tax=Microbacterium algeriense TaxID=2615184 RepID=UPI0022E32C95|nr:LuxR C-terminal-related transcriptional regulator [Microbacterium algeriense]
MLVQNFINDFINSGDRAQDRLSKIVKVLSDLNDAEIDARIRHALTTGDVDLIEDAYDLLWYELPSRFAPEILESTRTFDPEIYLRRPRLMHLTLLAHHKRDYLGEDPDLGRVLQMFSVHGRRYATRLADFDNPSDLLTAGTSAVIAARLDGAFRRADQLGIWLDDRLGAITTAAHLPWSPHHVGSKPGWLSTQRGLTATLSNDYDYAIRLYTRGYSEAGLAPRGHFAGANSAANLALVFAVRGHFDLARRWIERMNAMGPLPDWIEHLTALGAKIATALIAVEEGDPAIALDHLERMGPATQHVELWPFILYVRGVYHACFGDPYEGLAELEAARLTHGASVTDVGTTRQLLLRTEAKLLLRTHNATRVLHLVREGSDELPAHLTAWAHIYSGHPHQAIRVAARALHRAADGLPLSDTIELHLTIAVAHLRSGHTDRAVQSFQAATRLRSTPTHVKPFLLAPADDIAALAKLSGVPDPLEATRAKARPNPLHKFTLVDLTPRERAVLQALDQGITAVAAAKRFGVSPATVRSQTASIYRKLDVSNRSAALARAHELGLLDPQSGPSH